MGDYSGDGKQDLAVGNGIEPGVSILTGNGAGVFTYAGELGTESGPYMVVGTHGLVNGELLPKALVQEEAQRLTALPAWRDFTEGLEKPMQMRDAAEAGAIARLLLLQAGNCLHYGTCRSFSRAVRFRA